MSINVIACKPQSTNGVVLTAPPNGSGKPQLDSIVKSLSEFYKPKGVLVSNTETPKEEPYVPKGKNRNKILPDVKTIDDNKRILHLQQPGIEGLTHYRDFEVIITAHKDGETYLVCFHPYSNPNYRNDRNEYLRFLAKSTSK